MTDSEYIILGMINDVKHVIFTFFIRPWLYDSLDGRPADEIKILPIQKMQLDIEVSTPIGALIINFARKYM